MAKIKSAPACPDDPHGLNERQRRFVEEYMRDASGNASAAALRAGYAAKTAGRYAAQLMASENVQAALADARAARAERTKIDADWVLRRLADEAEADLADLIGDNGEVKPISEWPKIWRQGLVAGVDVYEETVEGVKVGQTVKLKLSDRVKRLELIGKHVGVQAFRDRLDVSNPDGSMAPRAIDASKLSMDALRELMGVIDETPAPDGG